MLGQDELNRITEAFEELADEGGRLQAALDELLAAWVSTHYLALYNTIISAAAQGQLAAEELLMQQERRKEDCFNALKRAMELQRHGKTLDEQRSEIEAQGIGLADVLDSTCKDTCLSFEKVTRLREVLVRLHIIEPSEPLLKPDEVFTGVAGRSQVLLYYIPSNNIRIIAKFDEPLRADREWEAIAALRLRNLPSEALLPHPGNRRTDGVLVYPVAGNHLFRQFLQLTDFARQNLAEAPRNLARSLELALEPLSYFYGIEPGQIRDRRSGRRLQWGHEFNSDDLNAVEEGKGSDDREATSFRSPKIKSRDNLRKIAVAAWPENAWTMETVSLLGHNLPNPLARLLPYLNSPIGDVRLSRIHGDLNLSNILVCPDLDGTSRKVNLIDLSHSAAERVTARDFAMMEADFWKRVFIPEAIRRGQPLEKALQAQLAICDELDGRAGPMRGGDEESQKLVSGARAFVYHIRKGATRVLQPSNQLRYMMADYFMSLFFIALWHLGYEENSHEQAPAKALLVLAATAAKTIDDQKQGRYSVNARQPLEDPTRAIKELDDLGWN